MTFTVVGKILFATFDYTLIIFFRQPLRLPEKCYSVWMNYIFTVETLAADAHIVDSMGMNHSRYTGNKRSYNLILAWGHLRKGLFTTKRLVCDCRVHCTLELGLRLSEQLR